MTPPPTTTLITLSTYARSYSLSAINDLLAKHGHVLVLEVEDTDMSLQDAYFRSCDSLAA